MPIQGGLTSMRFKSTILILSIMLILLVIPTSCNDVAMNEELEEKAMSTPRINYATEYQESGPIIVVDVFSGWPGSGTANDPYRIEGFNITSDSNCIFILNIQDLFVIRKCLLHGLNQTSLSGIDLNICENGRIENCIIISKRMGIEIDDESSTFSIYNNTIINCNRGIYSNAEGNVIVRNNVIEETSGEYTDWGIYVSRLSDQIGYFEVINNTVSSVSNAPGISVSSRNSVVSNNTVRYCRIGLSASSTSGIHNNTIIGSGWNYPDGPYSMGIIVKTNQTIYNNTISLCWYGMYCTTYQLNSSVMDNQIDSCFFGIYTSDITDLLIHNNIFSSTHSYCYGVYLWDSSNITITTNQFYNNGISLNTDSEGVNNTSIVGNVVNDKPLAVFRNLTETEINPDDYGQIIVYNCTDLEIANGTSSSTSVGIQALYSLSIQITNCTILQNRIGLKLQGSNSCIITDCKLYDNFEGVLLTESSQNSLYNNELGWNPWWNARSSGVNHWNDSSSHGNYWSDYNGTGIYEITGGPDIDYHPNQLLHISSIEQVQFLEGDSDMSINWTASALNPDNYQLHRNGEIIVSDSWNGSDLQYDIETLGVGEYNFTMYVFEQYGHNNSASIIVRIIETVIPTINHPQDIEYELGAVGNAITWTPRDNHPDSYQIIRNGTEIESSGWDGNDISINVDGRPIGAYNYTLIVFDTSGNMVSDSVIVSVYSPTTPTTTTTPTTADSTTTGIDGTSFDANVLLSLGIGLGILVVIVVILIKKR